jgi:hypothetical protein
MPRGALPTEPVCVADPLSWNGRSRRMKRMLFAWLGMAALSGLCQSRALAQSPDYPISPATDPSQTIRGEVQKGEQCRDSQLDERFCKWVLGLRPAVRRELMSNLLIGIHPLMAFVPTDGIAELPSDEAVSAERHFQILPLVLRIVGPDGREAICINKDLSGCNGDLAAPEERRVHFFVESDAYCVPCPYLVSRNNAPEVASIAPPDVVTNLQLLLKADALLNRGRQLVREGHLVEAVDCFQEVHCLVPGTNLEARAGEETENLLVQVYGTALENAAAEEPSEPQSSAPPAPCSSIQRCTGNAECSGFAIEHREASCAARTPVTSSARPRTIVYPVGDLLGKGKETRVDDLDDLTTVISNTIEPDSWADNGGQGTIEYFYRSRAIVVRQTPEVHEQIAELLVGLRVAKAESDSREERPHRSTPVTGRAVKADAKPDCCAECCSEKTKGMCTVPAATEPALCLECCPIPVLTLPSVPSAGSAATCQELQLFIEGCTIEGRAFDSGEGLHGAIGGSCAEAAGTADGLRLRWQLPVGPVTLLVKYEHSELTVEFGLSGDSAAGAEESETRD